jgi:O-methyltransferase
MHLGQITDKTTLHRLSRINGRALSTTPTLHNSYLAARYVIQNNIDGDLVECGIYAGSQCGAMALAIQESKSKKLIHGFDSFCGFPKASKDDDNGWQERLGIGSPIESSKPLDPSWGFDTNMSVDRVKHHFTEWGFPPEMFRLYKGWFQDTVPSFNNKISLLRLDGDLYESTMTCLTHLYPKLSNGGICIIDDWALPGCRKACDDFLSGQSINVIDVEGGGGPAWWIK